MLVKLSWGHTSWLVHFFYNRRNTKKYSLGIGDCYFSPRIQAIVNGRDREGEPKTYFAKTLKKSFWPEVEIAEGKFAILWLAVIGKLWKLKENRAHHKINRYHHLSTYMQCPVKGICDRIEQPPHPPPAPPHHHHHHHHLLGVPYGLK